MLQAITDALSGVLDGPREQLLEYAELFSQSSAKLEPSLVAFLAATLTWIGEWTASSRLLATLIDQARQYGEAFILAHLLAVRSDLHFRTGQWPAALADSARSEELARETGQATMTSYALIMRARVEAGLGRTQEASRRCQEALAISSELGCVLEAVQSAIGFVELTAGNIEESIRALETARAITDNEGLRLITAFPWAPDLVEAHVRRGSAEDAMSVVRSLETSPVQGELPLALLGRCQGLVAPSYDEPFACAIALHAKALAPFETARTRLAYGERLRRSGRRRDAIEQLASATMPSPR